MTKNKKILISSVALALFLITLGYFLFVYPNSSSAPENQNTGSPFGDTSGSDGALTQSDSRQTIVGNVPEQIGTSVSGLRLISSAPVSDGEFVFASGTPLMLNFIERATGNIFQANMESGSVKRISNTTIPKIEQVAWSIPGKSFLAQYIDEGRVMGKVIELSFAPTSATTTTSFEQTDFANISQFNVPENIISASFSPNGNQLFYLIEGYAGVEGYIATARGDRPQMIWQFPTTEWLVSWPETNTIALTSKASNGVPGVLYLLNTKTKGVTPLLSGSNGLTTNPSPSLAKILYTTTLGSQWNTSIYYQKQRTSVLLPFEALAEKCLWAKSEVAIYCARPQVVSRNAPDDWYQGVVSYKDTLWKFDLITAEATQISDLSPDSETSIDLINPHLSPDEKYISFTNKKDLSLWAVSLEN